MPYVYIFPSFIKCAKGEKEVIEHFELKTSLSVLLCEVFFYCILCVQKSQTIFLNHFCLGFSPDDKDVESFKQSNI